MRQILQKMQKIDFWYLYKKQRKLTHGFLTVHRSETLFLFFVIFMPFLRKMFAGLCVQKWQKITFLIRKQNLQKLIARST